MGAEEGNKSAKFWTTRLWAPTPRAATLRATPLGRTLGSPTLGAPPFGPQPFGWRPSRDPLFLVLGPYVPHFYHVAHLLIFCAFLIVSISCHFLNFSLFLFLSVFFPKKTFVVFFCFLNFFFNFSSWGGGGEGGGGGANPNTKQVSSLRGGYYLLSPSPKPQTSLGFGEGGGPTPPPLKPVSAAAWRRRDRIPGYRLATCQRSH